MLDELSQSERIYGTSTKVSNSTSPAPPTPTSSSRSYLPKALTILTSNSINYICLVLNFK